MLTENREKLYMAAGIFFCLLLLNALRSIPDYVEDVSSYPDMSYMQMDKEFKALEVEIAKPLKSGNQFYQTATRVNTLKMACKKYNRRDSKISDPRIRDIGFAFSPIELLDEGNIKRSREYSDKYPGEFAEAQAEFDAKPFFQIPYEDNEVGRQKFIFALLLFQFGFVPFALIIFSIRIRDESGSIAYELLSNPLFLFVYLPLWEVGIFKYRASSLRHQIRRMIRYASMALTAVLSFGAATLKAQTKKAEDGSSGQSNGHTLVVSGSTHYLPKYLGLDGAIFHPSPVWQSNLTLVANKTGMYVNFWKSIDIQNSHMFPNFGREEDYTIGKISKWKSRSLNVGVTYFNVAPQKWIPEGDLLQMSINISNLIPSKWANTYLWIRDVRPIRDGKPPGGQFVHFGANQEVKVFRKTRLEFGGEAVFDSGGFGFNRAGIGRWHAILKVPWKNLVFDLPTLRMSTPFTHPHDGRKLEQVVGIGLSFSFTH